jgi:hypothetical protein
MSTIVNSINIPTVEPSGSGQTTINSINIPTVEPSSLIASINSINFPLPTLKINQLRLNDDYVTQAALDATGNTYEHVIVSTVSIQSAKIVDNNPVTELQFADVTINFVAGSFEAVSWGDSSTPFGVNTPLEFGIDPTALELHYSISYKVAGSRNLKVEPLLITKISF